MNNDWGILECILPESSKWVMPILVLHKPDGDLPIFADDNIDVHQMCSNSYPSPIIESIFHELAEMEYFVKFNLKRLNITKWRDDFEKRKISQMKKLG